MADTSVQFVGGQGQGLWIGRPGCGVVDSLSNKSVSGSILPERKILPIVGPQIQEEQSRFYNSEPASHSLPGVQWYMGIHPFQPVNMCFVELCKMFHHIPRRSPTNLPFTQLNGVYGPLLNVVWFLYVQSSGGVQFGDHIVVSLLF